MSRRVLVFPYLFHSFLMLVFAIYCDLSQAKTMPLIQDQSIAKLMSESQYPQAREKLNLELKTAKDPEHRSLIHLGLGIAFFSENLWVEAQNSLEQSLRESKVFEDLKRFYLGLTLDRRGSPRAAKAEFVKLLSLKPNQKLRYETIFELGRIEQNQKKYASARQHFAYLAKRVHSGPEYPHILWELTNAELYSGRKWQACRWARRLYTKFPTYPNVVGWTIDLHNARIEGRKLSCVATPNDQQARIRRLQQLGESQRARQELDTLKARTAQKTKYSVDKMYARFLMNEGHPRESLNLLLPHYKEQSRTFDYLMFFGTVAARAGEFQAAVGSYYAAHKLNRKGRSGRHALYQAAFLSYQFQDYDGAQRKFEEFRKIYRSSGLSRDAYWHLAWIRYLKSDYRGAIAFLQDILQSSKKNRRHWRKYPTDRTRYWIAMSHLRMGESDRAKAIFAELAIDSMTDYYSVLSHYRLEKLGIVLPLRRIAQADPKSLLAEEETRLDMAEASSEKGSSAEDEAESEESLVANEGEDEGDLAEGDSDSETVAEEGKDSKGEESGKAVTEIAEDNNGIVGEDEKFVVTSFRDPKLASRFERAQLAMSLGLLKWARWELYEIERRTTNRTYLKALMDSYMKMNSYHRVSYIGQIYFSSQRNQHGITGVRYLWEYTYPKAYEASVIENTESFSLPSALVWSIMRAESHYRPEVMSPVGAMGLMQIMPYTGRNVATLLNEKDFVPGRLIEPEYNIRLGSRYLLRLMKKFDRRVPLVAAAYNAGPHRVDNWLSNFGSLDMDEFIEHIPFLETRNYVKGVLSNYEAYSKIYALNGPRLTYLTDTCGISVRQELATRESWGEIE